MHYGEVEAHQLAAGWARKLDFDYARWMESGSLWNTDFSDPFFQYVEDYDWIDWACGLDNEDPAFGPVMEIRQFRPAAKPST